MRAGTATVIVYAHDIEPPLALWWHTPQVIPRYLRDFAALVTIYGSFCRLYILRGPGLNFHETKYIFIPADQVDLSWTPWRPKIPSHNLVSELSQLEIRFLFSTHAGLLVLRPLIGRKQALCKAVQSLDDESSRGGGEHTLEIPRSEYDQEPVLRCDREHKRRFSVAEFLKWEKQSHGQPRSGRFKKSVRPN